MRQVEFYASETCWSQELIGLWLELFSLNRLKMGFGSSNWQVLYLKGTCFFRKLVRISPLSFASPEPHKLEFLEGRPNL